MAFRPRLADFVLSSEWAFELEALRDFLSGFDCGFSDKLFVTFLHSYLDFVVYVRQEIEIPAPDETFSFDGIPNCQEPSFT